MKVPTGAVAVTPADAGAPLAGALAAVLAATEADVAAADDVVGAGADELTALLLDGAAVFELELQAEISTGVTHSVNAARPKCLRRLDGEVYIRTP
ncbi:MAG TPA: hypothetical protein VK662_10385 [Acidothermaceae bacterium]|nr:hypothetical protein [Acidothermaceae bacterium]